MNFKNKVVVITGASSGIGEASAIEFAKKNANVVLVARRKEKLLQVQKKISKYTDSTLICQCDVSNKLQVKEMSDAVLDTFGRIDEQHSGHIVNVASVGASFSVPGVASYCATKFAMLGFSEGLRHELAGTGVGLTVVSPIMVRTPLFDHPSFENFSKFSTGVSLSSETVAKTIIKASNSSRLEIVVPSVARAGIWFKQTFPYLINPIIGNAFRKQLTKRNNSN